MKTEKHLSCKPVTATSSCAPKVAPFCFHKSKISGKSGERVNQYEKMPGTSPAQNNDHESPRKELGGRTDSLALLLMLDVED